MPILAGRDECTGCSACASVCSVKGIEMIPDEFGFLYPVVDESKCISCGRCEKVCPICSPVTIPEQDTVAAAAYSRDGVLRSESSSGGIFSEVALPFLEQGGFVYGAAYDAEGQVRHVLIEDKAELHRLRGAKYAQSDLNGVFVQIQETLKTGKPVLFSGTPCQVMGLKSFLGKDYENLVCVDFVCHGVPSPLAWREYIRYRCKKENEGVLPVRINLRSKKTGWSHYRYSTQFIYQDGKETFCPNGEDLFMKLFVDDYINRLSCENCKAKGYDRISDLTLGDFWGIWDVLPDMDDDKGVSLILVHTGKGQQIMKNLDTKIVSKRVQLTQASYMNRSILDSCHSKTERTEVLEAITCGSFAGLENLFEKGGQKDSHGTFLSRIRKKWEFIVSYPFCRPNH